MTEYGAAHDIAVGILCGISYGIGLLHAYLCLKWTVLK